MLSFVINILKDRLRFYTYFLISVFCFELEIGFLEIKSVQGYWFVGVVYQEEAVIMIDICPCLNYQFYEIKYFSKNLSILASPHFNLRQILIVLFHEIKLFQSHLNCKF